MLLVTVGMLYISAIGLDIPTAYYEKCKTIIAPFDS